MDKHAHVLLQVFVILFLQENVQGIKCLECQNCNHNGVTENKTCFTDGGYCVSTIIRDTEKDKDGVIISSKDGTRIIHRSCLEKDRFFLLGRALMCSVSQAMKHEQNVRCCNDQDLCNQVIPELSTPPTKVEEPPRESDQKSVILIVILVLIIVVAAILIGLVFYKIAVQAVCTTHHWTRT